MAGFIFVIAVIIAALYKIYVERGDKSTTLEHGTGRYDLKNKTDGFKK